MYAPNTPQPEYWILSLSGGKDSTALGFEWLKRHQQDPVTYPLHEVIYCDTGMAVSYTHLTLPTNREV